MMLPDHTSVPNSRKSFKQREKMPRQEWGAYGFPGVVGMLLSSALASIAIGEVDEILRPAISGGAHASPVSA